MKQNERELRHQSVMQAVGQMMLAARTAPKGKGIDILEIVAIDGADLERLAQEMERQADLQNMKFFLRDALNIRQAEALVLIGTRSQPLGMNCGYCGFATCDLKSAATPCAINTIDVGIALGSACATAADYRLDTRVMFSAGFSAQQLHWLHACHQTIAIAVSASAKNPFFDRKPKETPLLK
ncbi:MAG: DUF2148 domain-containing protein [Bacteroidaceae bacterium]